MTFGLPFSRGAVFRVEELGLVQHGTALPVQARVLDRWTDGSPRWVLFDSQVSAGPGEDPCLEVVRAAELAPAPPSPIRTSGSHGGLVVETGPARFVFATDRTSFPLARIDVAAASRPSVARCRLEILARGGEETSLTWGSPSLAESGPIRTMVRVEGHCMLPSRQGAVDVLLRLHFFAGSPTVRAQITIRNPRKAEHPGGFWDLGNAGSVFVKDATLVVSFESTRATAVDYTLAPGQSRARTAVPLELYQDSSGGEQWDSINHVNRDHVVPNTFRGYRLRAGGTENTGLRATPAVAVTSEHGGQIAAAIPDFWQNFPKAIEVDARELRVRLFPRQYADVHEIQGGEQKTHDVFVSFARDQVTAAPLEWALEPTIVHAEPAYYASTRVLPYLTPEATDPRREYLDLVRSAIEGPDTFVDKRERIDEYGWRHYGDVYGDHEAVRHTGPALLASHYNNQYDTAAGFLYQFLRSGDMRWWAHGTELARHVIDIDVYHTTEDKAAYNHGMFWHTYHYGHADTATHRTYPVAGKGRTHGGGPSADHNYTTGLLFYYFLTGDELARETVIDSAQYAIDIDDGRKTVFRWLDRGYTGGATASGSYAYHGPGRAPANSLNVLINAHHLTGERRFLEKAEQVIRRCVHPHEDIGRHDLLDAENKWFYTMFLQSLGKYLDYKVEIGQLDAMYAYAREAMVNYGRWMADHETPFLDRQDRLEFPTETWAAQDIRKVDVFDSASLHASGPFRARLRERAQFFFDHATRTLSQAPTKRLARPVIILLSSGASHQWFVDHPEGSRPDPAVRDVDFGPVDTFVPQRVRAMKRARMLVAAAGLGLLGGAVWLTSLML